MNKKKRFRNRKNILIIGLIVIVVSALALFFNHLRLTGFYVLEGNDIEKTIEIEVWANSLIDVNFENNYIESELISDDNVPVKNQEIEFYLENNLIDKQKTNSQGYAKSDFNLSKTSPGIYSLKAVFQGNPSLYLNSAEKEKQVDTTSNNLIIKEKNITTINLEGYSCKKFEESILWSSDYTNSSKGSTNYQTWHPEHNYTELNASACFLENVYVEARFLYFGADNEKGEGYIQISNYDKSICENPEQGIYSKYLAYDNFIGEGKKLGKYCGDNKNQNSKCGIQISDNYVLGCYGIKLHSSQYFIVDAFKINYELCMEDENGFS